MRIRCNPFSDPIGSKCSNEWPGSFNIDHKNDDYVTRLEEQKEIIMEAYDTEMDQILTSMNQSNQQLKKMNRHLKHLAKEKEQKLNEFEQLLNERRRIEETKSKSRLNSNQIIYFAFYYRSQQTKDK